MVSLWQANPTLAATNHGERRVEKADARKVTKTVRATGAATTDVSPVAMAVAGDSPGSHITGGGMTARVSANARVQPHTNHGET